MGEINRAESLLRPLIEGDFARDGYTLFAYIKLLCGQGRTKQAKEIWGPVSSQVRPERIQSAIFALIANASREFEDALRSIDRGIADYGIDADSLGQRLEILVAWNNVEASSTSLAECKRALQVMRRGDYEPFINNLPLLISLTKICVITNDEELFHVITARAESINQDSEDLKAIRDSMPEWIRRPVTRVQD
jgi:hypothetical protein